MRTLVRLTKAVLTHQAIEYQNGPLAGRRQEMPKTCSEVEAMMRSQEHRTETDQDEYAIHMLSRTSTSSRYSEDDDGYISMPDNETMGEPGASKTLLTVGKCDSERSSLFYLWTKSFCRRTWYK